MSRQVFVSKPVLDLDAAARRPARAASAGLCTLSLLALMLCTAAALQDVAAAPLQVGGGSGSGDYPPGTLVHIWANPYEETNPAKETAEALDAALPDRVFSHWSGDTQYLSDPASDAPTLVMPDHAVALSAEYTDAPRWIAPRAVKLDPDERQGIILLFHGHNDSAQGLFERAEVASFIRAALRRGLGILALNSFDRSEPKWDDTDDPDGNIDLQRLAVLWQQLLAEGAVSTAEPVYAVGISNGGAFAVDVARYDEAILGTEILATAIYGHPAGLGLEQQPKPTIFLIAEHDEIIDNDQIRDAHANLVNLGVPTQLATHYASPLYPRRFWRIDGISAQASESVAASIAAAGLLDPDGFIYPEAFEDFDANGRPDWWDAIPDDFERLIDDIQKQIEVTAARHAFFGDLNERTLDFLLDPTTVVDTLPVVEDFTPPMAPAGTAIMLSGSGFIGIEEVSFNGAPAEFQQTNSRVLWARVPPNATSGPILVRNPAGTGTSVADFIVEGPRIDSFNPASAPVGVRVDILGAHLQNVTSVTFGGVPADEFAETWDGSVLRTRVPDGAQTGPIVVSTEGADATSTEDFVVMHPPMIASIMPTSGAAGTLVTILGSGFEPTTGVGFNPWVTGSFEVISDTELQVIVPPDAVNGPLRVMTPAGVAVSEERFILE